MKVIVFCLLILNTTNVKAEEVVDSNLPLEQGRWNLGINTLLGYNTQRGGAVRLESDIQYFVADRLSFGVTAATDLFRGTENYSLGVVGTYYFYTLSKSAFYLSQSFTWDRDKRYSYEEEFFNARTTLGYNSFFYENVAFGPRIQYEWNPSEATYQRGTFFLGYGVSVFF